MAVGPFQKLGLDVPAGGAESGSFAGDGRQVAIPYGKISPIGETQTRRNLTGDEQEVQHSRKPIHHLNL